MEDLLLDFEGETSPEENNEDGVVVDFEEDKDTPEDKKTSDEEDNKSEEDSKKEEEPEEKEEDKKEDKEEDKEEDKDDEEKKEDLEEDLDDLDKILSDIENSGVDDAIEEVKNSGEQSEEVKKLLKTLEEKESAESDLKQLVNDLQGKIKSLNTDKSDLMYKNAELEAFGGVTDPSLMIVVRNYEKAKGGDQIAKDKIKRIVSDMYEGVFGEDIEKEKKDADVSEIAEINAYNSTKNPNVDIKEDGIDGLSF